jgi:S-adenosyl-L-methionine hydrolase (adenosine-forming)
MTRPITFLSDYGLGDEFVGVVHGVIAGICPDARVIDLGHGVPRQDVSAGAAMLARALPYAPAGVHLAVVDPEVGARRRALALRTAEQGRLLVGPDNGLLLPAATQFGGVAEAVEISASPWRLEPVSATFHGRDLFAPVAASLARGEPPPGTAAAPTRHPDWPDDLAEIVYVDHYGNAMTGLRAALLLPRTELQAGGVRIARARTFGDVSPGGLLWYANANGLAEIAAHGASAAARLGLAPGSRVVVHAPG